MRAKFINEVFDEESDPIEDMEIGRVECPTCEGNGSYPEHDYRSVDPDGDHDCRYCPIEVECADCQGTGLVNKKKYNELKKSTVMHKYGNEVEIDLPF